MRTLENVVKKRGMEREQPFCISSVPASEFESNLAKKCAITGLYYNNSYTIQLGINKQIQVLMPDRDPDRTTNQTDEKSFHVSTLGWTVRLYCKFGGWG